MTEIYRILYCSRNSISGSEETLRMEVSNILAKSRANNAQRGITGALLFNCGYFAQVLEGPLDEVESTFETIQRDLRHYDVSVLECGTVPHRDFPEWSMAFASPSGQGNTLLFEDMNLAKAMANQTTAASEISHLLRTLVLPEDGLPCPE